MAARIPSLRESLRGPNREDNSVLRWPAVPLNLAALFVNYIYTGQVELTEANARSIVWFARMIELPDLEKGGLKFLAKSVTLDNLATTWELAKSLEIQSLMDSCIYVMKGQFEKFISTDLFVRLPSETVLTLLRSDYLPVDSEEDVFGAISRWVYPCSEVDQMRLAVYAPTMLKEVRWSQTSLQFRTHLVNNDEIFKSSLECSRFMAQVEQWIWCTDKDKPPCPFTPYPRTPLAFLMFGENAGEDRWSVVGFKPDMQKEERVADMEKRVYASYSVIDGNIFVVGGDMAEQEGVTSVTEFLVRERRWRQRAGLALRRSAHAAAVVKAGGGETLLGVFGGAFKEGDNYMNLSSCEIYDVSRDRWFKLPDMREKRDQTAAASLPDNGRIFVFGGWNGSTVLSSVEFCQLQADWEQKATTASNTDFWQIAASMITARSGLAAAQFRGKIIVAGGYDADEETINAVEMFTPPDNSSPLGQWTVLTSMGQPRADFTLLPFNDSIFALGGNQKETYNSVEVLTSPRGLSDSSDDLKSWRWSSKDPLDALDNIWGAACIRL